MATIETAGFEADKFAEKRSCMVGDNNAGGMPGSTPELGVLCHNLNQPLMAISGLSEIMALQMADEDPLKAKMIKLTQQVEKMSGIVREIMNVSKQG